MGFTRTVTTDDLETKGLYRVRRIVSRRVVKVVAYGGNDILFVCLGENEITNKGLAVFRV